jgi:ubiquinone/menaquinone biosynthesis C-methylase UbiE
MRLATRVLLAMNRLSPRPHFPDRPDPESYASWEYDEAAYQLRLMEHAGVSLAVPSVLDVGCGLGGKSVRFSERGKAYVLGLDRSESNTLAARRFALRRGATRVEFAAADAARLPVRDGSFHLVISTDTFEHFADPSACLAEMARALRPGGRLVVIFGPFGSPLGSHLYDTIFMPWCHVLFSRDTLAEAVREIAGELANGLDAEQADAELRKADEKVAYFERDLNRMSLHRFRRLLRGERRLRVRSWKKWTPPKLRALTPLLALPGLDEYLTGLLVVAAERV